MNDKDYNKKSKYIKREFRDCNDKFLVLYLSQDLEDAKKEGKKPLLDIILKRETSLYKEIFSTIFVRDNYAIELFHKIVPYLDLKLLLTHLESLIKASDFKKSERYLDIYVLYSMALYRLKLETEFSRSELLCLEPVLFTGNLKFDDLTPEELKRWKKIDKEFIRGTMSFIEAKGRGTSEVSTYMMSESRPHDFKDIFGPVYQMIMGQIDERPKRLILLMSYIAVMEESIQKLDYEKAEVIIDSIFDDFKEEQIITPYYLNIKSLNNKYEEIFRFIETEYSKDQINDNPYTKMFLGMAYLSKGDVPKGVGLLKEAYQQSGRDPNYLINYVHGLFLKNQNEAIELVKKIITTGESKFHVNHIFFLIQKVLSIDIDLAKLLLDYYSESSEYRKDTKDITNYHYLHLLGQYYFEKSEYPQYISTIQRIIDLFPDLSGGYAKLAEFYSDGDVKDFFDLKKAIYYAKKAASIENVDPKYFIGICYSNAHEWKKCIEILEEYIEKSDVGFFYINAYMEVSMSYFMLNDPQNGCKWANEWFERYNRAEKKMLYEGSHLENMTQLTRDLDFLEYISINCRELGKRVRPLLENLNLWLSSSEFSTKLQKSEAENIKLRERIADFEIELQSIKERYRNIDFSIEENVETFFKAIRQNEATKVNILRQINQNLWDDANRNLNKIVTGNEMLSENIRAFIHTSEFLILANYEKADYSGVIINYAKAFETILHEVISKPFIDETGFDNGKKMIKKHTDPAVKNLFPRGSNEPRSITIGQWYVFIKKLIKESNRRADRMTKMFESHLNKLGKSKLEKIRKHSKKLRDTRNGSAHIKFIGRREAERDIKNFRKAITLLIEILYKDTS